jgi:hypothetical protein
MRADLGLDILYDLIECARIDIALLSHDRLERAHPELHLGQLRAVRVFVGMMLICGHGETFRGRIAAGSHGPPSASTARRRVAFGRARG